MANKKLSELTEITELTALDTLVAVRDNGDSTYTDYRVPAHLLNQVSKKVITVSVGGDTLSDDFFDNPITIIITDGQAYIVDVDFTQSGNTITGTTITFAAGQKIVAII